MITRNMLLTNVWTPIIDADVATFIVSLAGGSAAGGSASRVEYCFTHTETPPPESLFGHRLHDAGSITNDTRMSVVTGDLDGGEVAGTVEGSDPSGSSLGTWLWLRSGTLDKNVLLVVSS